MITKNNFLPMFNEVMGKQGYFVIAYLPWAKFPAIGDKVFEIAGWPIVRPVVISGKAKKSDWYKQADLISQIRPEWKRRDEDPNEASRCKFFKVVRP